MPQPRQSKSAPGVGALVLAAFAAACCIGWFLVEESSGPPPPAAPAPSSSSTSRPGGEPAHFDPPPIAAPQRAPGAEPAPSLAELEKRYRGGGAVEDRGECAREIAGANNADAVLTLARLFQFERSAEAKIVLISALGDIDPEAAPDTRFNMLAAAVGAQPRNVRLAALGSLAEIKEPHAELLIRRIASQDSDKLMREFAAKLVK